MEDLVNVIIYIVCVFCSAAIAYFIAMFVMDKIAVIESLERKLIAVENNIKSVWSELSKNKEIK